MRYRRKRKYQKLAKIGITNRRPRQVTRDQYKNFLNFKKTKKYPVMNEYLLMPTYLPGKNNILVRSDIYEQVNKTRDLHIGNLSFRLPEVLEKGKNILEEKEYARMKEISLEELGKAVREKVFDTWEEKYEWLLVLLANLYLMCEKFKVLQIKFSQSIFKK